MQVLIILTTTVYIQNKLYLFQTDPIIRILTYLKSINQWTQTPFKILIAENSGYQFNELNCSDSLDIVSFKESEVPEAWYLRENQSKGASELFSINYSLSKSKFKDFKFDYIFKCTGRYFIPGFWDFLKKLEPFDGFRQHDPMRCELLGCTPSKFEVLFNRSLQLNDRQYCNHIEFLFQERLDSMDVLYISKKLSIEPTQQGGINNILNYL
jgi:hypothetical protein